MKYVEFSYCIIKEVYWSAVFLVKAVLRWKTVNFWNYYNCTLYQIHSFTYTCQIYTETYYKDISVNSENKWYRNTFLGVKSLLIKNCEVKFSYYMYLKTKYIVVMFMYDEKLNFENGCYVCSNKFLPSHILSKVYMFSTKINSGQTTVCIL